MVTQTDKRQMGIRPRINALTSILAGNFHRRLFSRLGLDLDDSKKPSEQDRKLNVYWSDVPICPFASEGCSKARAPIFFFDRYGCSNNYERCLEYNEILNSAQLRGKF